jgi:DNA-binding PadR family transcriptional regulator
MRFLQPCLLVLLHRGEAHGYSLLNGLNAFDFQFGGKDPRLVYRALREMEDLGLVASSWDADSSLGPQRRVYRITPEGEAHLAEWMVDLRRTRDEIDALVRMYEEATSEAAKEP